jgi:hypothetical protein
MTYISDYVSDKCQARPLVRDGTHVDKDVHVSEYRL